MADYLRSLDIEAEFADPDHIVLMLTPENGPDGLQRIKDALFTLPKKDKIPETAPALIPGQPLMSIRSAMFSESEVLPVEKCVDRVLAVPTVGCPPAVPILMCGEKVTEHAMECFRYYGITECCVVKASG